MAWEFRIGEFQEEIKLQEECGDEANISFFDVSSCNYAILWKAEESGTYEAFCQQNGDWDIYIFQEYTAWTGTGEWIERAYSGGDSDRVQFEAEEGQTFWIVWNAYSVEEPYTGVIGIRKVES